MANTLETLVAVFDMLTAHDASCDIFGGWAEELLQVSRPRIHGDIDLVHRAPTFAAIDIAIAHLASKVREIPEKRFLHKRAFVFREVLCEIILVRDSDTQPVTHYWGDVAFHWEMPLLHPQRVVLRDRQASVVSAANVARHRSLWSKTQPHRWRDPQSLEMPASI